EPGRDNAVILGHSVWADRFGSDPAVIGRSIVLDGRSVTILGVMPPGFAYPLGAEVWAPLAPTPEERSDSSRQTLSVVSRLRGGTSRAEATVSLERFQAAMSDRYPAARGRRFSLLPLREEQSEILGPLLLLLQAAAALVLLLAAANVSTLLV